MPLLKSRSKKAFEHNLKEEIHAGKPKDQALAISYSLKRRAAVKKAKMAAGGSVESGSRDMNMAEGGSVSAASEKRPMPDNTYSDSKMVSRNSSRKDNGPDGWTDNPTVKQAQANSSRRVMPIKRASIVQGSTFKAKPHDELQNELHDQEADLQSSEAPSSPEDQPDSKYDESGPDRQGPRVPDMQSEHGTKRKPYAKGGQVEASDYDASPNKYEDDLQDLDPSHDEGADMAMSHNEMDADSHGDPIPDMEEPHNKYQRKAYNSGGAVHSGSPDMDYAEGGSVDEEREIMDDASTAAAIMSKRKRMAEGGMAGRSHKEIPSHESIYSDDSDQADLSRNADEDANEEDQLSFNSIKKENYSESPALSEADHPEDSNMHSPEHEEMDEHDRSLVSAIRRKMMKKSPISR